MGPIVIALLVATGWLKLAGATHDVALRLLTAATTLIIWRTRVYLLWLPPPAPCSAGSVWSDATQTAHRKGAKTRSKTCRLSIHSFAQRSRVQVASLCGPLRPRAFAVNEILKPRQAADLGEASGEHGEILRVRCA